MKANLLDILVEVPKMFIGVGAVEKNLGTIAKKAGAMKVVIVTDKGVVQAGLTDKVTHALEKEGIEFGIFDGCEPDGPIDKVKTCAKTIKQGGYDLVISLGGGSSLDIGKVASVLATAEDIDGEDLNQYYAKGVPRRSLPRIQISTTAGTGAEMSRGCVVTDENGIKRMISLGEWRLPVAAIIDPLLTLNLPQQITADTGLDALSHAIESYTHANANIVSDMFDERVIKLVGDNLLDAYYKGSKDLEARYNMAVAAGFSLVGVTMGTLLTLPHGMSHSLQVDAHCSHGASLAILMPHVMEFNMLTSPKRHARIGELLGEKIEGLSLRDAAKKGADAVRKLASDLEMPLKLREIGVKKEQFPRFIDLMFEERGDLVSNKMLIAHNPRICTREDAARILEAAW